MAIQTTVPTPNSLAKRVSFMRLRGGFCGGAGVSWGVGSAEVCMSVGMRREVVGVKARRADREAGWSG